MTVFSGAPLAGPAQSCHRHLGRMVARRPWRFVAAALGLTVCLMSGAIGMPVELDYLKLYVPSDSDTLVARRVSAQAFGPPPRFSYVLLAPKGYRPPRMEYYDGANGESALSMEASNAFLRQVLPAALEVADEIVRDVRTLPNATTTTELGSNRSLGLEDVCITLPVSPFLRGREGADRCLYVAPTGYWQGNGTKMAMDTSPAATIMDSKHAKDQHGLPMQWKQVMLADHGPQGGAAGSVVYGLQLTFLTQVCCARRASHRPQPRKGLPSRRRPTQRPEAPARGESGGHASLYTYLHLSPLTPPSHLSPSPWPPLTAHTQGSRSVDDADDAPESLAWEAALIEYLRAKRDALDARGIEMNFMVQRGIIDTMLDTMQVCVT